MYYCLSSKMFLSFCTVLLHYCWLPPSLSLSLSLSLSESLLLEHLLCLQLWYRLDSLWRRKFSCFFFFFGHIIK
jgi:hypothetical protein